MHIVIERMSLRKRRKKRSSGGKNDIYRLLYINWARCRRVYADERQRLQMRTNILLFYIFDARLISLFDTRVTQSENVSTFESEQLKNEACTADSRADSKHSESTIHSISKLVTETTIENFYSQTHAWLMSSKNSTSMKRKQNDHEMEERRRILRKCRDDDSVQSNEHVSREKGGDYTDIDSMLEMRQWYWSAARLWQWRRQLSESCRRFCF